MGQNCCLAQHALRARNFFRGRRQKCCACLSRQRREKKNEALFFVFATEKIYIYIFGVQTGHVLLGRVLTRESGKQSFKGAFVVKSLANILYFLLSLLCYDSRISPDPNRSGPWEGAITAINISPTLKLVYSLGSMRPLCCDQPETLTQGCYSRVGSIKINAAPRRIEQLPRYKVCCCRQLGSKLSPEFD